MIELIDQSGAGIPGQPDAFTFRCDQCGAQIKASTKAWAERHRCDPARLQAHRTGVHDISAAQDQAFTEAGVREVEELLAPPKPKRARKPAPAPVVEAPPPKRVRKSKAQTGA